MTACCCASARSSRGLGFGRCRRGFWKTARRSRPARCARPPKRRALAVEIGALYTVISLPDINQVYMMFRARLLNLDFGPGPESLEVALFAEDDIPWGDIAFRTIARTLRNYFLDRKLGAFPLHVSALFKRSPREPALQAAA